MFFRVGYNGNDTGCFGEGARYPSFWLKNDVDKMMVSVSGGTQCQVASNPDYPDLVAGQSYHVFIESNDTTITVKITGGGNADHQESFEKDGGMTS